LISHFLRIDPQAQLKTRLPEDRYPDGRIGVGASIGGHWQSADLPKNNTPGAGH
jgi:hypothetical protein